MCGCKLQILFNWSQIINTDHSIHMLYCYLVLLKPQPLETFFCWRVNRFMHFFWSFIWLLFKHTITTKQRQCYLRVILQEKISSHNEIENLIVIDMTVVSFIGKMLYIKYFKKNTITTLIHWLNLFSLYIIHLREFSVWPKSILSRIFDTFVFYRVVIKRSGFTRSPRHRSFVIEGK